MHVFQVLYVACVGLWFLFPDLKGHEILTAIFPGFKSLDLVDFLYGFIMSAIYGWVVAVVFVFFYNGSWCLRRSIAARRRRSPW
jgi:hypothetical protein